MASYLYTLYGLTLESFLPLPQLAVGEGDPDVVISEDKVPDQLPEAVKTGVLYQAAPGRIRLALDGVAKYLITDGNSIVVERAPEASDDAVRVFLLGSAMGGLLHQRGWLPLHASAIEVDGECVAFAGYSGGGKSTLAAALHGRGYRVIADDVVAVKAENGGPPLAFPAYAELRLWADALEKLEIDSEGLRKVRPEIEKSRFPTGESMTAEPLPITRVYLLTASNRDELKIVPIEGMNKLGALTRHTYRRQFLEGLGGKKEHFRLCVALSKHARLARIVRPSGGFKLDELVDLVVEDLAGPAGPGP